MKFKFKYSIEDEKQIIKTFYDLKKWMVKQGYGNISIYPKNADPFKKSLKEIYQLLEEEFNEKDYEKAVKVAEKSIKSIKDDFAKYMISIFGKKIDTEYIVTLSKYGFGGLYNLPNFIGVQFTMFKGDKIKYIIMHETIHLFIEEEIQKYKVNQHEKERIVALIQDSSKLFPGKNEYPTFGGTEAYMDSLFKELFFEDREEFFKQIKNVRKTTKQNL